MSVFFNPTGDAAFQQVDDATDHYFALFRYYMKFTSSSYGIKYII